MEKVSLFAPGSLGMCWSGKFHYLEPWVGCQHSCPYCYARSRNVVTNSMRELGNTFSQPALQLERPFLLKAIEQELRKGEIHILKLCRFTDIFTPAHVADGLSHEIMEVLVNSPLKRIIITTKGRPSPATLKLIAANPQLFSYNAALHPACIDPHSPTSAFDRYLLPWQERLDAAATLAQEGVQTTIHLDPLVATVDDREEYLYPFLEELKKRGLNRVMWSYLLLSEGIMQEMQNCLEPQVWQELLQRYNLSGTRQILSKENDTASYAQTDEVALASIDKLVNALSEGHFEYVLCSLKSVRGLNKIKRFPPK